MTITTLFDSCVISFKKINRNYRKLKDTKNIWLKKIISKKKFDFVNLESRHEKLKISYEVKKLTL